MGVGHRRTGSPSRWRPFAPVRRLRFGRTLLVAVLSVSLAVGAAAIAGPAAQADGDTFTNGRATAVSQVLRVAPGVGSLSLAMAAGVAIADFSNSLSQAQAQILDTGLIGNSLTAEQCDGSAAPVKPDDLPQPVQADNRKGDASASSDELPLAGSALGGGHEEVSASGAPLATSTVTTLSSVLGPVLTVSAARSDATSGVIDGVARQAEATVSVDLTIADVIHLRGVKWNAVHRTGADGNVDGTFTIAEGDVGSVPLPVEQSATLQDALNTLLASTGLSIELPHVERLTDPNDLIRVTPLRITLRDSPLGKAVLGPVLNLTRTQREQLFNAIIGFSCKAATSTLLGDVALDVASGTGFLVVEIGGVEASSSELAQGNPFGAAEPFGTADAPIDTPSPVLPASGVAAPALVAPAAASSVPAAARTVAATGPLEEVCETLHVSKHPGCSHGMGVPIGLAGIALTAAIAYLDWRRQRRLATAEVDA